MKNSTLITAIFVGIIVIGFVVGEVVYTYKKIAKETQTPIVDETAPKETSSTTTSHLSPREQTSDIASVKEVSKTQLGLKTYTNDDFGFTIQYPQEMDVSSTLVKEGYYNSTISRLVMFVTKENNLDEVSFSVYADNNPVNIKKCLTLYDGAPIPNTKVIHGNTFWVAPDHASDSAMGGVRGEVSSYRILRDGYCYMIGTQIRWHEVGYAGYMNNGVYSATPEERQAQKDAVQKYRNLLDSMVSSFTFLGTPVR